MSTFLIRADGSPQIGGGHIMRCLTLADALRPYGSVTFFSAQLTPALSGRIEQAGHSWVALANLHDMTPIIAQAAEARAIIVDSYALDSRWRQVINSLGPLSVALDDLCDRDLWADVVVNSAACAPDLPYDRYAPHATRLLGPSYALVSQSIRQWRDHPAGQGGYVLLTFGGSDPLGLTLPVAERLAHLPVLAILGGSMPDRDWVANHLRSLGVMLQIDTPDMGKWIRRAKMVVTAGGSTVNEVALLGRPAVAVIVADNQMPGCQRGHQDGWLRMVDGRQRRAADHIADVVCTLWGDDAACQTMADKAATQSDGCGADRIAHIIQSGVPNLG